MRKKSSSQNCYLLKRDSFFYEHGACPAGEREREEGKKNKKRRYSTEKFVKGEKLEAWKRKGNLRPPRDRVYIQIDDVARYYAMPWHPFPLFYTFFSFFHILSSSSHIPLSLFSLEIWRSWKFLRASVAGVASSL